MRPPSDLPRRRPRARRMSGRGRTVLIVLAVALFLLITSLRGVAGFYTDYLWFDSLGLSSVWRGVLGAKIVLGAIFTGAFFLLMWVNLLIADRLAPRFRPAGPEEEILERYHELVGARTGLVRAGVALLFALIAGVGVAGRWNDWILFTNRVDFGVKDAQFDTEVGFFVFQLPFLDFLVGWTFAALVTILFVTAGAHYLNGGIRVQTPLQRVTPQVKAHLSVLLGVLALIKAADYWLQRYELDFSTRGAVHGASYTDVKAQLPALQLLILIALFAAGLFIWNIRRRGWVLPVIGVGLWGLVFVVAAGIVPAFVQRVQVDPAESTKERPYIKRNIDATRLALNLDDVEVKDFDYGENLSGDDLQTNSETIRNVRLLDPARVEPAYQRLQGVRAFYRFNDLDVDRYLLDGRNTQVVISARELDPDDVPQKSWEGQHLAYTHGYGLVLAPANGVTGTGQPDFRLRGVPPEGTPEVGQPAIYFGEDLGGYAIVRSQREEIDYQLEDGSTQTTTYEGSGGVRLGSLLRRTAFALRFGDVNPVISNFVDADSRILYIRDIRDRVEKLAPFLHFDADPYPVIMETGEVQWVIDAYTTSDRYPYAQDADTGQLPSASGLDHGFNYVRNSVKAVVNAFDGSVTFYIVDPDDPIARAYHKAFPDLFEEGSEVPAELREHFRYPEDLFRVQTNMWGRYHIGDPQEFYEQTDSWNVAQDPGTTVQTTTTQTTDPATGELSTAQERRIDPYYLLMRLPGEEEEEFLAIRPFVPFSANDERRELSAFMVAKSDPDDYGKLQAYVMPRGRDQINGPALIDSIINQQEDIAREISLLDQRGSSVKYGNLLLIPIEESILYVRPLYVQSQGASAVPELKKVIVVYGDRAEMQDTLQLALAEIFGDAPETLEEGPDQPEEPDGEGEPGEEGPGSVEQQQQDLLERINQAFQDANAALGEDPPDLGTYQREVAEAEQLIEQLRELVSPEPESTTTTEPADDV